MILTIAHTFAYALIQTFGFSIFTLALQHLGRLKRLYRLKAFFFLLLMNAWCLRLFTSMVGTFIANPLSL